MQVTYAQILSYEYSGLGLFSFVVDKKSSITKDSFQCKTPAVFILKISV